MKILVSESQLRNLVKRHRKKMKDGEVDEAASLTSPSTSNQTTSSSASSTSAAGTDNVTDPGGGTEENGKSMGADEYSAYPKVSTWSDVVGSTLTRGHANPLGNTKWESGLTRGPANQLT